MASELDGNHSNFLGLDEEILPKSLETMIDDAVKQDFSEIRFLTDEDRQNDMYKAMKFGLECAHVKILYERKVITEKREPIIPREQFLFGFRPTDGLCIFTQKKAHKIALCDSPIRELAKQCFLTQSLQYILVEIKEFRVWSYVPVCCGNDTCSLKKRPLGIRQDLFEA